MDRIHLYSYLPPLSSVVGKVQELVFLKSLINRAKLTYTLGLDFHLYVLNLTASSIAVLCMLQTRKLRLKEVYRSQSLSSRVLFAYPSFFAKAVTELLCFFFF